ncbi:MAG: hypothetical protein ACO3E6_03115, partial [Candidatus Nanopelagicaceae bacterium]
QEIANFKEIDPATKLLITLASHQARDAEFSERSGAESGLSEALKLLVQESDIPEIYPESFEELQSITDRLRTAIAIHREAVSATRKRRSKLIIRAFRLAGRAPLPVTYAFEDDVL